MVTAMDFTTWTEFGLGNRLYKH